MFEFKDKTPQNKLQMMKHQFSSIWVQPNVEIKNEIILNICNIKWGRQVVSKIPIYSDYPSSNLAEAYSFILSIVWKTKKIKRCPL